MAGVGSLQGKTALVTGGNRGIGRAICGRLQEAGATVVRLSRSLPDRDTGETRDIRCDITNEDAVRRVVESLREAKVAPDILVNNAGSFLLKSLASITHAEFRSQLDVNLLGPFLLLRAFAPLLAERGGHVVTIGSISDHRIFPDNAAYGASKHGLRALHEVLAEEYRGLIRTTLVSPGPTDTELWDPVDPDARGDLPSRAVMLRPDDVADAVLFAVTRPSRVGVDVIRLTPSGLP